MLKGLKIIVAVFLLFAISACGINSDIMFRTPKGHDNGQSSKYYKIVSPDSIPNQSLGDYRLSKDDKIKLTVSPNDGKQIIESMTQTSLDGTSATSSAIYKDLEYTIRTDGFVNLPLLGDIKLLGLTIKEAEDTLKKDYLKYYIDPFVMLNVVNKRVIVFPGGGGDAKVIYLQNNNTRLMEVLAEAGGLSTRGKSKSIKLMRMVDDKRIIVPIDLSTVNGLAYADIIVQGNDYIYVEPHPRVVRQALEQATPFLSFVTTILLLFNYFTK